jgi:hypothetical protein
MYREDTLQWLNYWTKWCARVLSNTNESSIQFNLEMNKKSLLNDSGSIKTLIVFKDVLKLYETLARIWFKKDSIKLKIHGKTSDDHRYYKHIYIHVN